MLICFSGNNSNGDKFLNEYASKTGSASTTCYFYLYYYYCMLFRHIMPLNAAAFTGF